MEETQSCNGLKSRADLATCFLGGGVNQFQNLNGGGRKKLRPGGEGVVKSCDRGEGWDEKNCERSGGARSDLGQSFFGGSPVRAQGLRHGFSIGGGEGTDSRVRSVTGGREGCRQRQVRLHECLAE